MRRLHLSGSPTEMGEMYGVSCREEIHELYRLRVATAANKAKAYGGREVTEEQLLEIAHQSLAPARDFDKDIMEEVDGIARGADLDVVKLIALNGLTDFWDAFAWGDADEAFGGCTAILVPADQSATGHPLCGQTWDLATDNQPFVLLVERKPTQGPGTLALTCTGCLTLAGLNDEGLAVGTTNLRTSDARAGIVYTWLLHRALREKSVRQAASAIKNACRAGAHFYFLADANDVMAIEASPHHFEPVDTSEVLVQGNHCTGASHRAIEAISEASTSIARVTRMQTLVEEQPRLSPDLMRQMLSDTAGGTNAISRDDLNGVSSNGAVIMSPASKQLWACHGPPHRAAFDLLHLTGSEARSPA